MKSFWNQLGPKSSDWCLYIRRGHKDFPVFQWLGLQAFTAKGQGFISDGGTRTPQVKTKQKNRRHRNRGKAT